MELFRRDPIRIKTANDPADRRGNAEGSSRDAATNSGATSGISLRRVVWEYAGIIGCEPGPFSLRELEWMVIGRVSHHWDLFAPLICYVANPWLDKKHVLSVEAIHPFLAKKPKKAKKFNRADWLEFKSKIKGG